ncbi:MAG: DUF1972 domain-containing protein [Burkholderiales bacterium]
MIKKQIMILGTRGVPAAHGGFETFAEHLALYLVKQNWDVTVYCQEDGAGPIFEDNWQGVRRIRIPVAATGAKSTIIFDWKSTVHASKQEGLVLTLGYNTAVFCALYRLSGHKNLINMDGIEWHRQKWGAIAKAWFWMNDWAGCWLGNHLIADHPAIKQHLATRVNGNKITTIPYGADSVESAELSLITQYELEPGRYAILIARAEPENSILEVVRAWSRRSRGMTLVILGKYDPGHAYQRAVKTAASNEIRFIGAVYDKATVAALRFYAQLYIHGHQVGGTNPSLVESLGAGNAVLAHDNIFNRWVAGDGAKYFGSEEECAAALDLLLDNQNEIHLLKQASKTRFLQEFTWGKILKEYEDLLLHYTGEH